MCFVNEGDILIISQIGIAKLAYKRANTNLCYPILDACLWCVLVTYKQVPEKINF